MNPHGDHGGYGGSGDGRDAAPDQARGLTSMAVRRPVLTVVINLLIVVAGIAALLGVEVRELPNVDRPIVTVRADFPGAAPDSVDNQVTGALEGAIARVPGVVSISSRSSQGSSRVTVEFSPDTDLNIAASDVREAVSRIQRRLPDDVDLPRVIKADDDASPIMLISVISPSLPINEVTELTDERIVDRLASVDGVADVMIWGSRGSEISVTFDEIALASRGLTVADLEDALATAGLDSPAGTLGAGSGARNLIVRADAALTTAEEIAQITISGSTRVGDVAAVAYGPEERSSGLRRNGSTGVAVAVIRQAGSNTLDISRDVRAVLAELDAAIDEDINIAVTSDDAIFVEGSVREVLITLAIATMIVISVIFIFLRSWRTTLIPAVTVPVALIGTVAGIWLMGFSVNILTLLALVLATGMVVDDAIVVLENIARHRRGGSGSRASAVIGTRQVFFAVLATTATLIAVFVPLSFMPGTAGGLFREFGFVLAVAVVLSTLVALTLAPMMASRLDATRPPASARWYNWPDRALGVFGDATRRGYSRALDACLKVPLIVVAIFAALAILAYSAFLDLPEELTPDEDRGTISIVASAPSGSALDYTDTQVRRVETALAPFLESGEVQNVLAFAGRGGSQTGFITLQLADWSERERSQAEITADIEAALEGFTGARINTRTGNSLGIRGGGQGLSFALTGNDYERLAEAGDQFVQDMNTELGSVRGARLSFDTTLPQLSVRIDRDRANDLGIPIDAVAATLQAMTDGRDATELFVAGRSIPVRMAAGEGAILGPDDLENAFVSNRDGRMLPLSSVVTMQETAAASTLNREAQQRAVPINAGLVDDAPLRSAMTDVERLAAERLPQGMGITFLGEAAELQQASSGFTRTLAFAVLIVLLVLAAQFESVTSAAVIMATVPLGLAAAVLAVILSGGSLNIYSQIGLIMIVGLMAKNGILIVEFANQLRDAGYSVQDAIREAAEIRFRPVVMTMVSTVLGGLPLVLSSGPGAEARQALGWIIVGGLGLSAIVTLFLTPVMFALLAGLSKPRASEAAALEEELRRAPPIATNDSTRPRAAAE